MDQTDGLSGPVRATGDAADLVSNEAYRKARIIGIAATFVALGIAILVKYFVTGVVVRDRVGCMMLVAHIVLGIVFPFSILRRKHGKSPL